MDRRVVKLGVSIAIAVAIATAVSVSNYQAPTQKVSPAVTQATKFAFDQDRAFGYLTTQVNFGTRVPGSPTAAKCREWIIETAAPFADSVQKQPFSHVWSQTGKAVPMVNIIAEQNWKNAKVRVVLMAHWDTRPTADMESDPDKQAQPIPGANDGASGVAVLLELMRVLKDVNPDLGIQYVFVDGEDLGPGIDEMFLGAVRYSSRLPSPKPNYGILLDMIGDKDLTVPMEANSMDFAPDLMRALYGHAAKIGLQKTFPATLGDRISDDHLAVNAAGVPMIDLIDFTYPSWHTLQDTPDKCSAESLGKVGKLLESWFKQKPLFGEKS